MLEFKHNCKAVEEDLPMPFEGFQIVTCNKKRPTKPQPPHFMFKELSFHLSKVGFNFFLVFKLAK